MTQRINKYRIINVDVDTSTPDLMTVTSPAGQPLAPPVPVQGGMHMHVSGLERIVIHQSEAERSVPPAHEVLNELKEEVTRLEQRLALGQPLDGLSGAVALHFLNHGYAGRASCFSCPERYVAKRNVEGSWELRMVRPDSPGSLAHTLNANELATAEWSVRDTPDFGKERAARVA